MTQMVVTTVTQSLTACRSHGERGKGGRCYGAGVILCISLAQTNTSCSVTLPRQPSSSFFEETHNIHQPTFSLPDSRDSSRYLIKYCPLGKNPYFFISFSSHQTGTAEKNRFGCWDLIRSSKMEKRSE